MAIISRGLGFVVASYTGTGSAVALDLGFIPAYAKGWDVTDGNRQWEFCNGFGGVTGGATFANVVATMTTDITAVRYGTPTAGAGGIVPLPGSNTTGIGLTIGTNTDINVSGHGYVVMAWEAH